MKLKGRLLSKLRDRASDSLNFYSTHRAAEALQKHFPKLHSFMIAAFVFLMSGIALAEDGTGSDLLTESNDVLCATSAFLHGGGGWFIIAVGFLLIVFDLFVQKQAHLLAIGVVAVVTIVVVGKILCRVLEDQGTAGDCGCGT